MLVPQTAVLSATVGKDSVSVYAPEEVNTTAVFSSVVMYTLVSLAATETGEGR